MEDADGHWVRIDGELGPYRIERVRMDVSAAVQKEEDAVAVTNTIVAVARLAGGTVSYAQSSASPDHLDFDRCWLPFGPVEVYFDSLVLPGDASGPATTLPREMHEGVRAEALVQADGEGRLRAGAIVLPDEGLVYWCGSTFAGRYAGVVRNLKQFLRIAAGAGVVFVLVGTLWQMFSDDGADWGLVAMIFASSIALLALISARFLFEDWPGLQRTESIFRELRWPRPEWIDLEPRLLRRKSWSDGRDGVLDLLYRIPDSARG